MKNIQIQKRNDKYIVKLHYGNKDEQRIFSDADELLDFVGKFLRADNYFVINIKEAKVIVKGLLKKLSNYITTEELEKIKNKIKEYIKGID